jgi:isopenicillin-N N-acyltransferase-like protein
VSGATPFPFPLVDVEGGARERGRQYGRLTAECIATSLRVYMAAWTAGDSGVAARTALLGRARAFEPVIGDRYPELLEEMRGIAEGELWLCPGPVCENDYQRFTLRAR